MADIVENNEKKLILGLMIKFMISLVIIALSLLVFFFVAFEVDVMRSTQFAQKLEVAAKSELHVGTDKKTIEEFFSRHSIIYSFDKSQVRYQGVIRNIYQYSPFNAEVAVYVKVDDSGNFLSVEFQPSLDLI
jgi:hypothetical protein